MLEEKKIEKGEDYKSLKEMVTIGEILETAIAFEQSAFNFYSTLKDKVSKRLRPLVQELANEEQSHLDLFQTLSKHPELENHIADLIEVPPSDHRFSDYILLPKPDDFRDEQAILQYALGREQVAMQQYDSLAKETPPGPIQDLFRFLANEELEHKKELEKWYYEIVHSGGV